MSKGALVKYEEFYVNYSDELSGKSNEFIDVSIQARDKAEKVAKRRQRQIIGGLTGGIVAISMVAGVALWQLRRATISEINALSNSAEALLALNQEFDALIAGLKVGRKIENSFGVDAKTRIKLASLLQNILTQVKEFNHLGVGMVEEVTSDKATSFSYIPLLDSYTGYGEKRIFFSPNGKVIAFRRKDGKIQIWNIEGKLLYTIQGDWLVFNSNGRTIATIETFFEREGGSGSGRVGNVTFSTDGSTIALTVEGTIKVWHQFESGPLSWVESLQDDAKDIEVSPDGTVLASLSDSTLKLWNIGKTKQSSKKLIKFSGEIIATVSSLDEPHSLNENVIELWNSEGKLIKTFQGHTDRIENIEFSPDGKVLASTSNDNTIKLWNLNGELLSTLPHKDIAHIIKFSPNGKIIASANISDNGNLVKLWNLNGKLLNILSHDGGIDNIKFSPNGKIIISVSRDKTVKIWNLEGELLGTLSHKHSIDSVLLKPDGENIVISSGGYIENRFEREVKLWNWRGELLSTFPHTGRGETKVSPDGKIIISSDETEDNSIEVIHDYFPVRMRIQRDL